MISGRTNDDLAALRRGASATMPHGPTQRRSRAEPATAPRRASRAPAKGLLPVFLEPSLADTSEQGAPSGEAGSTRSSSTATACRRASTACDQAPDPQGSRLDRQVQPIARGRWRNMELGSALLDGEVVVEDEAGRVELHRTAGGPEGRAHRPDGLLRLRSSLSRRLRPHEGAAASSARRCWPGLLDDAPADGVVRFSAHIEGDGEAMSATPAGSASKGIVSKRKDRPYIGGPRHALAQDEVQRQRQEFVIAGYVPSTTSTKGRRLARHGRQRRRSVCACRPGRERLHRTASARSLWPSWNRSAARAPPFAAQLAAEAARGVRWVEPKLVAEVELRRLDGRRVAASLVLQGPARRQGARGGRPARNRHAPDRKRERKPLPIVRADASGPDLWPDVG